MKHPAIRRYGAIAAIGLASLAAYSVDPPDLKINPVSGLIETVDATWSGSNYNVRYTAVTTSGQQVASMLLTTNAANDVDPRIGSSLSGDVVVVWWRDLATDALIYRKRSFSSGAWSIERAAGIPSDSNSHPRIVYVGDRAWVAYQAQRGRSRCVGAQVIDDDAEPVPTIVATPSYSGDLDIQLFSESRHLWVTWIDSASYVGYSQYLDDKQSWSMPALEPFAADSPAAARLRIRGRLLGL